MPLPLRRTPGVRLLSPSDWLHALLSPQCQVELIVCRYHLRQGAFDSHEHAVDQHLVSLVEQGRLTALVAGRELRVRPGEMLWVPPGCSRRYHGPPDAPRTRQYNLRFRLLARGRHLAFLDRPRLLRQAWPVQPTFQQLHDLYQHGHACAEVRLRGLLAVLATTWMGLSHKEPGGGRRLTPGQRLRLDRYVVDHIAEPIGPGDLAREAGLSPDYFSRLFRMTYGVSPRTHLKRERVRLACIRLRETALTVAQIACELGVINPGLFCRQFREVMGCTPTEYRRRERDPLL